MDISHIQNQRELYPHSCCETGGKTYVLADIEQLGSAKHLAPSALSELGCFTSSLSITALMDYLADITHLK
jgi:hypothetical protein